MITVKREGVILRPTKQPFESKGVFNPGVMQEGNDVHLFYRAWNHQQRSTIGYCKLKGPLKVVERFKEPLLKGDNNWQYSVEDPRVVKIDDTYYMAYTGYDGKRNVRMHYSTSKDLINWNKGKSISPEISYDEAEDLFRTCRRQLKERYFLFESYFKDHGGKDVILWSKDHFLFPKKIKGKFALLTRILPDIQIIYFKDFQDLTLEFWKKHLADLTKHVLLESKHWYETRNVGGGCPPIETDHGWLLIYHAVDDMDVGKTYRASAALLDKNNPQKIIAHLHEPLLSPAKKYETEGNVPNVVFPTGTAIFNGRLYIYYGAADKVIAAASVDLQELLHELVTNPKNRNSRNKR